MLHGIGQKPKATSDDTTVDHLLACHQRIRHFTGVAKALANAAGAPSGEVASAASGVLRYFTEALPKHSADEDESVAPRLRSRADDEVREALARMEAQHEALHRTLDRACDLWAAVAGDPDKLEALAGDLAEVAADLASQWDVHLALEESTIFPAARALLTPDEHDAIQGEMRARRQGR
jgi:hemerythrin-like domain-containing protein